VVHVDAALVNGDGVIGVGRLWVSEVPPQGSPWR
jgi:hypothetical protein